MPINARHPEYKDMIGRWRMIRHAAEGEWKVKQCREEYLPRLGGQDELDYLAYLGRAMFFEATSRTLEGLLGSVFRKRPVVQPDSKMEDDWLKVCTAERKSIDELSRRSLKENLITGKLLFLVDAPKEGFTPEARCWVAVYPAEQMINWDFEVDKDGKLQYTLVVIEEDYTEEKPEDPYVLEVKQQWRELAIIDGQYTVRVWRKAEDGKAPEGKQTDATKTFYVHEVSTPLKNGKPLDHIPVVVATANNENTCESKPPLESVASVNISHYKSSADLEHGRHYTALPTPYATGISKEQASLKIGSQTAWMISEPNAKVGMLEFTGHGLTSLEKALEQKENLMAVLGARLLEEPKLAVEAAETHKIRKAGEESVLASVARATAKAINDVIKVAHEWDPVVPEVTVELNTDYGVAGIDSAMLVALVSALQSGAISSKTFFYNLQCGEMYPDDLTYEKEQQELDKDAENNLNRLPAIGMDLDAEDDEDEGTDTRGGGTPPANGSSAQRRRPAPRKTPSA